jgi:NAD+ synthase (glutamine-hydrolysing)
MRIGFAQFNTTVGDIQGNRDRILSAYTEAVALDADLVLTPELALTGYPPQDLVFKSRFVSETLEALVEEQLSPEDIAARGFELEIVRWIQRKVDMNEYKRRQAAPGLRVTSLAFGMGWRMPIAQRYLR